MAIGLKVSNYWFEIGTGDFFHCFFSNIAYHLEKENWGSIYPILMNELYQAELKNKNIDKAIHELKKIQIDFGKIPPSKIIWDIENLSLTPPWGDNISPEITNLSNYFLTSNGKDLFEIFFEALLKANNDRTDLLIQ
ncbi:immunity 70 family protein [Flavobacterium johnsoniae]|uniref:immunity 70 family protein n=1 Tax=Flavobacterium johnsoniae TaxID=986 RepID=UPI0011ED80BC|nr:immunity 70 family protein [Flavobacterium johnsoniae]